MDIIGYVLIGTITGIGGGTVRDLLLDRTVWWTQNPVELLLCVGVSLLAFFIIPGKVEHRRWMTWSDALGLSAFTVIGCHVALSEGVPAVVAIFMGMLTATGGGVIRDTRYADQPPTDDYQRTTLRYGCTIGCGLLRRAIFNGRGRNPRDNNCLYGLLRTARRRHSL